jgi:hypothetical protein
MSDGTVIMSALADMEVVAAYRRMDWAHKSYDTYASALQGSTIYLRQR